MRPGGSPPDQADVVSAVSTPASQAGRAGSNPVVRSVECGCSSVARSGAIRRPAGRCALPQYPGTGVRTETRDRSVSGSAREFAKLAGPVRIRSVARAGGGMQTRRSQEPVPRKGCEGANPSRRTEGEPARRPGSPAKRCAAMSVAFKSPAVLAWEMKSPGGDPRLESGWGPEGPGIQLLRLPLLRTGCLRTLSCMGYTNRRTAARRSAETRRCPVCKRGAALVLNAFYGVRYCRWAEPGMCSNTEYEAVMNRPRPQGE